MRGVALLVLLALGCENERAAARPEPTGSAAPVAIAPPVIAIDAAVANVPLTVSSKGLSILGRYEWWKHDDDATLALLRQRITLPGVTVAIVAFEVDREMYAKHTVRYWSVRRGDTELLQVLRDEGGAPEGPRPVRVVVLSPDIPTDDGIRVGDKASAVFARHSDARCEVYREANIEVTITSPRLCYRFPGAELKYVLAERGPKLRVGPLTRAAVANLEIIAIVHQPFDE